MLDAADLPLLRGRFRKGKKNMQIEISRRQFLGAAGAGIAGTAIGAFGFGGAEEALAASIRPYKLTGLTETRNTCPYCSVACGIIMYSKGADPSKGKRGEIVHIEGDPDHPTNKGTLCPKGSSLLDFVKSPTRTTTPLYRKPGSDKFEEVSWDFALDRIAKLMKADRDANFVAQNKNGTTVNRWTSTGFLAASATTNETAFLTYKVVRSTGMVVFDNQARV